MFTLERVRSRHFTKAWSFVQGAKTFPVLIGIPITGYINQTYPKAGYYFSFVSTVLGASLMFLVGTKKEQPTVMGNGCSKVNAMSGCICPYNGLYPAEVAPYALCRRGSNHYERVFSDYEGRHTYRPQYLPKSLSYAANIDQANYPQRLVTKCLLTKLKPSCFKIPLPHSRANKVQFNPTPQRQP